jgi:DNA-binding winged helix-turn-helix (wHTH) protein
MSTPTSTFTFGPFVLQALPPRLTRDGAEIRLRPQLFHVLRVLLRYQGEYVSDEVLAREAWKASCVTQHTIGVTIAELRRQLAEYGRWIVRRPKVGYAIQIPGSDALVRQGWHLWSQRTLSGCTDAIDCFTRAITESPWDACAYEGLSAAYLSLAIFGAKPPREMYPRFLEAHQAAESRSGPRPELRCNRGFALGVFERQFEVAEAELLRARDEFPAHAATYVRLGLLYGAESRFTEAAEALARGHDADPLSPTLAATEILIHTWRRDFTAAVEFGQRNIRLHPYLHIVRFNYAEALEFSGQLEAALAQYQAASAIAPDVLWLRAFEGACLARLGRVDEARALLEGLEAVRRTEYVDAYRMATLRAALGQRAETVLELDRAIAENSAWLYTWSVCPRMEVLMRDVRVRRLRERRRAS